MAAALEAVTPFSSSMATELNGKESGLVAYYKMRCNGVLNYNATVPKLALLQTILILPRCFKYEV